MSAATPPSAAHTVGAFLWMTAISAATYLLLRKADPGLGLSGIAVAVAQGFVVAALCGFLGPYFLFRRGRKVISIVIWAALSVMLPVVVYVSEICCGMAD